MGEYETGLVPISREYLPGVWSAAIFNMALTAVSDEQSIVPNLATNPIRSAGPFMSETVTFLERGPKVLQDPDQRK